MSEKEAISYFLSKALKKRWSPRYISMLATERGRKVFLEDLSHNIESRFDSNKMRRGFSSQIWQRHACVFSLREGFGKQYPSLETAFNVTDDSCLIIEITGTYGIYKPEDSIDRIKYWFKTT
ncbi:MAG: hypothetical protein A2X49_02460 [Lentisphaerae bacterium GWF2_52_8]|nr:MAG: hypothetical protein A2X49_02460 [Lentisphaerae bacterium GWF2_52_8]